MHIMDVRCQILLVLLSVKFTQYAQNQCQNSSNTNPLKLSTTEYPFLFNIFLEVHCSAAYELE